MASTTRTVTTPGQTVFDFNTLRRGTVAFFSNDLNIDFRMIVQAPGVLLNLHAGPILFLTTANVGGGARVTLTALNINSGFPPPPLSLVQLQTDTINQSPSAEET